MNKPWAVRGASGTSYNPSPPPPPLMVPLEKVTHGLDPTISLPGPPAGPTALTFISRVAFVSLQRGWGLGQGGWRFFLRTGQELLTEASILTFTVQTQGSASFTPLRNEDLESLDGQAGSIGPKYAIPRVPKRKKILLDLPMVCTISYFLSKSFIIMIFRRMEIAFLETKIFTVYWR